MNSSSLRNCPILKAHHQSLYPKQKVPATPGKIIPSQRPISSNSHEVRFLHQHRDSPKCNPSSGEVISIPYAKECSKVSINKPIPIILHMIKARSIHNPKIPVLAFGNLQKFLNSSIPHKHMGVENENPSPSCVLNSFCSCRK